MNISSLKKLNFGQIVITKKQCKLLFCLVKLELTMDVLNVYLSDNIIDESVDMLLRLANSKSMPFNYYVVVVSDKEDELLVMYSYSEVNTDRFIDAHYKIVGFGKGKNETKKLIQYMIEDVLINTGEVSKSKFMTIRN